MFCININRSSGSDATKLTRKPISFAASQPLAEAKKAHKPQQQELQQLDKQLTGTGEKYDLFFCCCCCCCRLNPESIASILKCLRKMLNKTRCTQTNKLANKKTKFLDSNKNFNGNLQKPKQRPENDAFGVSQ